MNIIALTKEYLKNKDFKWLYDFIANNQIDKEIASEIFSLVYDHTNSFKNSNTTSETMTLAWKLISLWVPHDLVVIEKTKKNLSRMKFIWEVLNKIKNYNSWKILFATIENDLFEKYDENIETLQIIINETLFSIKNVEAVVFFIKEEDCWKPIIRFKDNTKKIKFDLDSLSQLVKK
ncbi:MAG: hypothetical protein ACD_4C00347G0002 [uncultured bacterium (gcode 4)]|uniref:Uncharacterized protein n=1 Tax=uncultured bacterium (gcode 4) TaxID=1234023 RepID=K2G862_9BACT|nr:MAG: hypothetical protein ACD_4C00347G0002 [uncultured bacterium (gcode 4)]